MGLTSSVGEPPVINQLISKHHDKERNTKVDAADPRIDHLCGTDCNGNDLVHGTLLEVKSEK